MTELTGNVRNFKIPFFKANVFPMIPVITFCINYLIILIKFCKVGKCKSCDQQMNAELNRSF